MLGKRSVRRDNDASIGQEKRPRSGINDLADVRNARFIASDRRERPAGLIFMCSSLTKRDCFRYKVFGLPVAKRDVVERVTRGMRLFLFDFDSRELYGIYEAVSHGGMNLEPKAFQGAKGSYPAQVRFEVHKDCMPLSEDIFKDAIKENYYSQNKFDSELSSDQVLKLTQLFYRTTELPRKRTDSLEILSRIHQADRLGQGLLGRSVHVSDPVESSYGGSHYRLPSQASRMEDKIPGHVSLYGRLSQNLGEHVSFVRQKRDLTDPSAINALERLEHNPRHIDAVDKARLLQMQPRRVGHLSEAAGLLDQDRVEDVDRLALKYLQQAKPVVGNLGLVPVDRYGREAIIPHGERVAPWIGNISVLQQNPRSGRPAIGNVSVVTQGPVSGGPAIGNVSVVQPGLVNRSAARHLYGPVSSTSNIGTLPSALALGRRIGAGDFLRQQIGRRAVRRS